MMHNMDQHMGSEHFIHDKALQKQRTEEKRKKILEFLSEEIFTTTDILSNYMELDRTVIYRTLKTLEKKGFVKLHQIIFEVAQTGKQTLWGITPMGATFISEEVDPPYFEPSKVAITTIAHSMMIQKVRVKATKNGYINWKSSRTLKRLAADNRGKWLQIPDAIAEKDGEIYAIEVERTVKTARRYRSIMANFIQMFWAGRNDDSKKTVDRVLYLCPPPFDKRLEKIFYSFETVSIGGKEHALNDNAKARFKFYNVLEWEG